MPLSPGTRLGPYEIIAPLGAGSMGEVYRARDTKPEIGSRASSKKRVRQVRVIVKWTAALKGEK